MERDREYLRWLCLFHYAAGAANILLSSVYIVNIIVAIVVAYNPRAMDFLPVSYKGEPPPVEIWQWFGLLAGILLIVGWLLGIVTIISGRMIAQRRGRVFSLVVAGANCALGGMLGIALGICTILVLCQESVIRLYNNHDSLLHRV